MKINRTLMKVYREKPERVRDIMDVARHSVISRHEVFNEIGNENYLHNLVRAPSRIANYVLSKKPFLAGLGGASLFYLLGAFNTKCFIGDWLVDPRTPICIAGMFALGVYTTGLCDVINHSLDEMNKDKLNPVSERFHEDSLDFMRNEKYLKDSRTQTAS